jgi:hypothetical protein
VLLDTAVWQTSSSIVKSATVMAMWLCLLLEGQVLLAVLIGTWRRNATKHVFDSEA